MAPSNFLVFSADGRTLSLSWDPVPQSEVNGELKGYTILVNDSNHDGTLFVSPCFSSLQLKNKTFSSNTCIRMAAVTKVGLGKMTSCTKIDVGKMKCCSLFFFGARSNYF